MSAMSGKRSRINDNQSVSGSCQPLCGPLCFEGLKSALDAEFREFLYAKQLQGKFMEEKVPISTRVGTFAFEISAGEHAEVPASMRKKPMFRIQIESRNFLISSKRFPVVTASPVQPLFAGSMVQTSWFSVFSSNSFSAWNQSSSL